MEKKLYYEKIRTIVRNFQEIPNENRKTVKYNEI